MAPKISWCTSMAAPSCAIAVWPCPWRRRRISGHKWDGATSPSVVEHLPDHADDGTSVRREVYGGASAARIVYTIEGGGHTWPGGPQYLPAFLVGKASHNLDATETIWGFFKKHSR